MHHQQRAARRWRVLLALLATVGLATAAACGGDDAGDDSGSPTAPEPGSAGGAAGGGGAGDGADATLAVESFEFVDLTVPAGGTVEVVNTSGAAHTVTADDGSFDEDVDTGDTVTFTAPDDPGEYRYHCEIHPSMTATLTVE